MGTGDHSLKSAIGDCFFVRYVAVMLAWKGGLSSGAVDAVGSGFLLPGGDHHFGGVFGGISGA